MARFSACLIGDTFASMSLVLSGPQIMRMSHGHYPCSEEADETPTQAYQTEKQERENEAPSRQDCPTHRKVAWVARDEAHQEGNEGEDSSCENACHEAEPTPDGDSANDNTDEKTNEEAQHDIEEF